MVKETCTLNNNHLSILDDFEMILERENEKL